VCGIAGILQLDRSPVAAPLLRRMIAEVRHRGPDAAGVHVEPGVGLGHARLSIIDLAGGRQPMTNEDGTLWVTFNGEIFNYLELRESLEQKGHRFATRSDTEVILHLYEEHGDDCVRHFNGQWALALWDRKRRRLLLSRDRLGVRPLFYATTGRSFLFASEVKALFAHPEIPRQIDLIGLDQVFTYWTTLAPRTVFEGVAELPPGHNLVVERGRIRPQRYWQLDYAPPEQHLDKRECADRLLELLTDAARLRLRSDVPVGAYLSGGLDSTLITATIQRCSTASLRTFSVAFDDAEFDESRFQAESVAFLGTEHCSLRCDGGMIGRTFPEMIRHIERPLLRTAPAPLYLLAQRVREEGYKVVLTGEGADELLGGYDLFKEAKVRRFWAAQPGSARRAALLEQLYPYLPGLRAQSPAYRKAFFHVRPEDLAHPLFSHLPRWELTSRLKAFFSPEVRASLAGRDTYADCLATLPDAFVHWHPFCQAQYLETSILLPGYLLAAQGDRVAMAHGVEGRYPFLDHRVAEFAASIPPRWKMRGVQEKHILRCAARDLLPRSIAERTKQPYRAPDIKSFFGDASRPLCHAYVEELLSPRQVQSSGVFDAVAVGCLMQKIRQGRAIGVKDNMALVGILSTQLVIDQFIERFSRQPAQALASAILE